MIGRCYTANCLTQLHLLAPEPGTPMFDAHGAELAYDGHGGPYNTGLVGAGDEATVRAHPDLFQTYHYYPAQLPRAHHIFAVEALDRMRRVGPIVLGYVLRAYGGQLSRLVAALRDFTDGAPPDAERVVAYMARTFGAHHHVTSLFRYALCRGEPAGAGGRGGAAFDPGRPYQLSERGHVLSDIHDCAAVLAQVAALPRGGELLDDAEAGELGAYVGDERGGGACWIGPGVQAIAELFVEPHTCREVADLVCTAIGATELDLGVFEGLVRAGVLVASPAQAP
jgi:hypothetical protein